MQKKKDLKKYKLTNFKEKFMKKIIFLLSFCFLSPVYGNSETPKELIGKWKLTEIKIAGKELSEQEKETLELLGSWDMTRHFQANGILIEHRNIQETGTAGKGSLYDMEMEKSKIACLIKSTIPYTLSENKLSKSSIKCSANCEIQLKKSVKESKNVEEGPTKGILELFLATSLEQLIREFHQYFPEERFEIRDDKALFYMADRSDSTVILILEFERLQPKEGKSEK